MLLNTLNTLFQQITNKQAPHNLSSKKSDNKPTDIQITPNRPKVIDLSLSEPDNKLSEKCGVFGLVSLQDNKNLVNDAFSALSFLQHRGQEAAGVSIKSDLNENFQTYKGVGSVDNVFRGLNDDKKNSGGKLALGHVLYPTSRAVCQASQDKKIHVQPIIEKEAKLSLVHNGNIPDTTKMTDFLKLNGYEVDQFNDSEKIAKLIAHFKLSSQSDKEVSLIEAIKQAAQYFDGAYSIIVADDKQLVAFRDPQGLKPLTMASYGNGSQKQAIGFASEDRAFKALRANPALGEADIKNIEHNQALVLDLTATDPLKSAQTHILKPEFKGEAKYDSFENVYFQKDDTNILNNGMKVPVYDIRYDVGQTLAQELKEKTNNFKTSAKPDVVIALPETGVPYALGCAHELKVPYHAVFKKVKNIRSFIEGIIARKKVLKEKFSLVEESSHLKGKNVVLIDDSIVRGNTLKQAIQMLKRTGIKSLRILSAAPPVAYRNISGIDIANEEKLFAAKPNGLKDFFKDLKSHFDNFQHKLESITYLPLNKMLQSYEKTTGIKAKNFNTESFSGKYPVSTEYLGKEFNLELEKRKAKPIETHVNDRQLALAELHN
jgi:amidophosphoribosyltransferase